jgi:hypothetical protein
VSDRRLRTVYLSGPISLGGTSNAEEIARFLAVFTEHEARLAALGYDVINPCDCAPQPSWEDYMRLGLAAVCRADVVAVLPRWLESRGAVLEAYVARQLAIPVVPVETVA